MEDKAGFELKKSKFEYEVKDFVPVIRKSGSSRLFKIVCAAVSALVLCLLGFGLYRHFIYREKLSPEEACSRALKDCISHSFGENSYFVQDIDGAEWYRILSNGRFDADASIRLKSLADFGLGFESYLGGAGIKTRTSVDSAEKKLSGDLAVTWTIITVPLADYGADSDKIVLTSPDFFKESILINKKDLDFSDLTVEGIYESMAGDEMESSAYSGMEIGELLDLAKFDCSYSELPDTRKAVVCGREETCYGYKIEAVNELFEKPVEFILYMDREYRLVSLDIAWSCEKDGNSSGFEFKFSFEGELYPSDRINGSLRLYSGEDEVNGQFASTVEIKGNDIVSTFKGGLSIPDTEEFGFISGIDYTAEIETSYSKEDKSYRLTADLSDGYDTVEIQAEGVIENDTDTGVLATDIDKLTFKYSGKEIFTARLSLKFSVPEDGGEEISVEAHEPVLNLFEITEDDIRSLYDQARSKIDEYMEMLEDFM